MNAAVYILIGLWVLLPTVFYIMLRWDMRNPRRVQKKWQCACGKPNYVPETPYVHSPQGCGPQREMIG